jgi:ElaA protein
MANSGPVTEQKGSLFMPTSPFALDWQSKAFDRLTVNELYDVMRLRIAAFIVEQQCCYQDADGLDISCWHLLGRTSAEIVGYLRVLRPGQRYAEASVGRLAVDKRYRGTGLGRQLAEEGLRLVNRLYPGQPLRVTAQQYLERFYESFGFVRVGEPFSEDGIPHVEMYLNDPTGSFQGAKS